MTIDPRAPEVIVADITTLRVDAIVNAANSHLESGGGVCGAIHRAAGPELARACRKLGRCPVGEARLTDGFGLPAQTVIHAVGPIYRDGNGADAERLASCYRRSLVLAHERGAKSIAFPCISTGIFGYPHLEAARIACGVIRDWLALSREPSRVICCCFSQDDAEVYNGILAE